MKKITLSILAFGVFMLSAQAQTVEVQSESKEVRFGAKAGLNIADLSNAEDGKIRPNFHIGGVVEFTINEKYAIQSELIYSRQGSKASGYEDRNKVDIAIKQDYVNIPIMFKQYHQSGFSIQMGPQVGFLVRSEYEEKMAGLTVTQDLKSAMRSVDFGLNFGVGYNLPEGLFFDARYNLGLTNIFKESFGGELRSQNRVFQLSVGYKF